MDNNFAGLNGFIWWVGVVENTFDPLKIGRVRVRIIGWHTEDINLLPSENLPWADVLLPVTSSNSGIDIKEGDWVMGFFTDGENAQKPVVIGQFNGIRVYDDDTSRGFTPQLTDEQKKLLPQRASSIKLDVVGEPNVPRQTRGDIEGTGIEVSNKNITHVCDVSAEMSRAAAWVRLQYSTVVEAVRKAIRAILAALGASPEGVSSRLKEIAAAIKREAKKVKKFLDDVNAAIEVFNNFIKHVNDMIKWILSLPAKLVQLLQDCLKELQKSLSKSFSELFSTSVGGSSFSAINDIAKTAQSTVNQLSTTVNNAVAAAQNAASVVTSVTVIDPTPKIRLN